MSTTGIIGALKARILASVMRAKPTPREYSATDAKGYMVPCQVEAYFLALNRYLVDGDRVLDVGFGLGYGLNILAIKAREIVGVEVDHKALQYCTDFLIGRNPRIVNLSLYDGYHLDFPDRYFNVVTCVDVLEHVEDYHSLLKEMMRVSERGTFISTPNQRPEFTNSDGTPKNYWHLREWNFEGLSRILKNYGDVEWNFLNGPFEGPFTVSNVVTGDTLTLSPFVYRLSDKSESAEQTGSLLSSSS